MCQNDKEIARLTTHTAPATLSRLRDSEKGGGSSKRPRTNGTVRRGCATEKALRL